jgi:LysM repeat protein
MRAGIAAFFASFFAVLTVRADGPNLVHVVQVGDTLASIAQTYYGDPKRELVLAAENGLLEHTPGELAAGLRLAVPVVQFHTVVEGDTYRDLAARFYGDPERASVLLRANDKKASAPPEVGAQLVVPYPLRHTVRVGETTVSVLEQYYPLGRDEQRLFRAFYPVRPRAQRGHILLIPIADLKLSLEGQKRVEQKLGVRVDAGEARAEQARIEQRIPELREHVQHGRFVEAVALGNQLLGSGNVTGYQQNSIQRELATAYVALEREDLAIASFLKVLEKQPDLELDSVRTSPRVLRALFAARKQLETDKQPITDAAAVTH